MLPVTVTGSAFDRKIVSVLPVPFCQVLERMRQSLTILWLPGGTLHGYPLVPRSGKLNKICEREVEMYLER